MLLPLQKTFFIHLNAVMLSVITVITAYNITVFSGLNFAQNLNQLSLLVQIDMQKDVDLRLVITLNFRL